MAITLSHRIEIKINNEFKTYCRKAFGISRYTWNWALEKVKEKISNKQKVNLFELKKEFNLIKRRQFPFVLEVTKYASQQPFIFLMQALEQFYVDLKSNKSSSKRRGFPNFKKKRHCSGSFYIGGDQVRVKKGSEIKDKRFGASENKYYLHIPKFGWVMLREAIRFPGKIISATISQDGEKFFASFNIETSKIVFEATHRENVQEALCGCDWGVKDLLTFSNGIKIKGSKYLRKKERKLTRLQKKLAKKQHRRTKGDKTPISKNYVKQSRKVGKLYRRIKAQRLDENEKISSVLVRHFRVICVETLNVKGMMSNHRLAKAISDNSPYALRQMIKRKAAQRERTVFEIDQFYASSKTCRRCGAINKELKLRDRNFICPKCGFTEDRDVQAAKNLTEVYINRVGSASPELLKIKPVDLTALLDDLAINGLATSREEAGI